MNENVTSRELLADAIRLWENNQMSEAVLAFAKIIKEFDKSTDPAVLDCVSAALINLGVIYAARSYSEQAAAAFDEVVRRFSKHSSLNLQNSAAKALYYKAELIRITGRGSDAIAAFTKVVDEFADAPTEELRHWAGIAQYNKAIDLARLGDFEAAVMAAEQMVQRFATSIDPEIRVGLAKALFMRELLFRRAGFVEESVERCRDIQARFNDDLNPEIQAIVAAARRFHRLLGALDDATFDAATGTMDLEPTFRLALGETGQSVSEVVYVISDSENASGAGLQPLTVPEVLYILQTGEEETPPAGDLEAQDRALRLRLLREQLQRDLESHFQSGVILAAYLDRMEPFGLFLRNFDIEGYWSRGSGAPGPIRVSVQYPDRDLLEERVAATIGTKLPFIGVGNNAPIRPDFKQRLPRIRLSNDRWQEVVEELIGAASIIVMDIERLTPGVRWELGTVERLRKQDQTVVILSNPREESVGEVAESFYGLKRPEYPVADPADAEFRAFKRIVRESELPENLADSPSIIDLISDVEDIQKTEPSKRTPWYVIKF